MTLQNRRSDLTRTMLNSLIPAQILSASLTNLNAFLDSIITGSLLGAESIAAIGFIQPITMLIAMIGGGLASGAQVLCGRFVGRGDGKGANRMFSITALWSVLLGAVLTLLCNVFAEQISALMGAQGEDLVRCADYLRGMSWSIMITLFSSALFVFMQLDNASGLAMAATIAPLVANIGFDFVNVALLDLGMLGIGLATTMSYLAMLVVGVVYYFSGKCSFRLKLADFNFQESGSIFTMGMPGAVSPLALALRALVINNLCFRLGGTIAVSAAGIFYNMSGFASAAANGIGGATGILSSVFVGERNRSSLLKLEPMALRMSYIWHAAIYAVVWLTAKPLAILFGTAPADISFVTHAIRCSMTCVLFNPLFAVGSNIYKSVGNTWLISICAVLNYFVFQCSAALGLSSVIGIDGVWFASVFSELGTYLVMLLFCRKKLGRFPKPWAFVYVPESLSASRENRFDASIRTIEEAEEASRKVIELGRQRGMDSRRSYYCGLCIEEQCVNIIQHGFTKTENAEDCSIELRVIFEDGKAYISLRDNCKIFDPTSWKRREDETDMMKGMGIRMVQELASSVSYHHPFGLNVLSIEI